MAGPFDALDDFPEPSPIATTLDREEVPSYHALLTLRDNTALGCKVGTWLSEFTGAPNDLDYLAIWIYRGMQERAFDFQYSDQIRHDNPWLAMIDEQYLAIAETIYAVTPFLFAIIDFEGPSPSKLGSNLLTEIDKWGSGCLLPNTALETKNGAGWVERPSGLSWLPPREY